MAQVKRNVYRKAALDRLSSPDQLDRMITIVPAGLWMALAGGAIAVVLTILWSIVGRIPVTVQTNGIFMTGSGVQTIYAGNGGIIDTVNYKDGDFIEKDAVIAVYRNEEVQIKIDNLNDRKKLVEAVTINSKGDIGSEDNKPMLDLKSQLLTVGNNYGANEALLEAKLAELDAQKSKTDAARDVMAAARDRYYASLNEGSNTPAQLRMQDALNDVNNARQDLQNAKADYDRYRSDVQNAKSDYNNAYSYLAQAQNALANAKQQNDTFNATYDQQKNQLIEEGNQAADSKAFAYHELYMIARSSNGGKRFMSEDDLPNFFFDKNGHYIGDPYYGSTLTGDEKFDYTNPWDDGIDDGRQAFIWDNIPDPKNQSSQYGYYLQMKNQYLQSDRQLKGNEEKKQQLENQKADYANKVAEAQRKVDEELRKVAAADAKYAAEISQNPGEQSKVDSVKSAIDSASSRYYSAEEAYLSGEQAQLAKHADSGIASADYNFALDA
ncbi:MAG: hypothetical protein J5824_08350, partial [Lachnospiraceae bacterium]|nr:hypothetical protein [Lachnospiraceae bacterium]